MAFLGIFLVNVVIFFIASAFVGLLVFGIGAIIVGTVLGKKGENPKLAVTVRIIGYCVTIPLLVLNAVIFIYLGLVM